MGQAIECMRPPCVFVDFGETKAGSGFGGLGVDQSWMRRREPFSVCRKN